MALIQTRQAVQSALQVFAAGSLKHSALALFEALGYHSHRRLDLEPNTAAGFIDAFDPAGRLNPARALLDGWQAVEVLFQLAGDDIRRAAAPGLFTTGRVDNAIIESYLFLAVALAGERYTRTQLAQAAREINRLFNMPVMVLFRHGPCLTLAVINRRLHRRDESKDVLEKVTLIKDIRLRHPHRAHLEILSDLALPELYQKYGFSSFVELHRAWQQTLDSAELNKRFFREVANWYFWAVERVTFPPDAGPSTGPSTSSGRGSGRGLDREARNAAAVIRLITRLIFVWFLKEKGLVPDELFYPRQLNEILKPNADPKGSAYYKAILQNLFFATLNQEMNAPGKPDSRKFRGKADRPNGLDPHYMVHNVYRYQDYFQQPGEALKLFSTIPFLNGGLFECLDRPDPQDPKKILRIDGFSERPGNPLAVPDELFFGDEREIDLNEVYGTSARSYKVRGLINILDSYKFTVDENTPIEEEIALDPELLGKVFENLLAAYNPETGVTARKQTGSFYTPREIVNYMVDESLVAYLQTRLPEAAEAEPRLRHLLAYNDRPHQFGPIEVERLIEAIDNVKILDPAAGSGAFPMGILHKLVFILGKLDPHNERWKERQVGKVRQAIEAAEAIDDAPIREATVRGLERQIEDIEAAFSRNELDYGRKLYLIENCIYGVDIQPIAVQIAKLRCFISLVVDERIDDALPNRGIRPLPNLETKFVAANTLIGIDRPQQMMLRNPAIDRKEAELAEVRRRHFTARTPKTKEKYRLLDQKLRAELGELLRQDGFARDTTEKLAGWNPYDQNTSADFFDPEWMFGVADGFDIVIGNPPYGLINKRQNKAEAIVVKPGELEYYKTAPEYAATASGMINIFRLFILKSINLLRNSGIFSEIFPLAFVADISAADGRASNRV